MANLNKLKKYHFIYKTTNLINDKFYIGMHSTNNLNDGYLGSGKRLIYSVNKYGEENFKLEILEFFDNRELLIDKEKELVNEELLSNPNCLNLKFGGSGGFHKLYYDLSIEERKKWHSSGGKRMWELHREEKLLSMSKNTKKMWEENKFINKKPTFLGKKHKPETIEKFKNIKKNHGIGNSNSQFGTCWITNGFINKKISKLDAIPDGWRLGRIIKNS